MAWLLLILLVALPVAELAVLVQVGGEIGVLNTIGLLILVSLVGMSLVRRAGVSVIDRMRRAQAAGRPPSREVADGALILLAAVLLVVPGFITDVVAILLLLPPTRAVVRTLLLRHLARGGRLVVIGGRGGYSGERHGEQAIWDVESWEETPPSRPRGQIGGGS